ncbi:MAG: methyltransferase domain-containing protein [Methyloglobulus sp.]|nr:methyltransferase domain-containing protein [Methyloglobulus sp.]
MNNYKDFGWSDGATPAHDYLYDDLLGLLGNNKTILDIGCGNGVITNRLIRAGIDVFGIDASVGGIKIAKKQNPDRFFVQDLTSGQLPDALQHIQFDTLISTEVIEHLYCPRGFVEFCKRILLTNGQGGNLIISCPYHGYLKNLALAITGQMDYHFQALWDGGHIKFWSKKTLTQLLEESGFRIIEFKGSGRFPFMWKSMFIKASI